jgi:hypothetical protein
MQKKTENAIGRAGHGPQFGVLIGDGKREDAGFGGKPAPCGTALLGGIVPRLQSWGRLYEENDNSDPLVPPEIKNRVQNHHLEPLGTRSACHNGLNFPTIWSGRSRNQVREAIVFGRKEA